MRAGAWPATANAQHRRPLVPWGAAPTHLSAITPTTRCRCSSVRQPLPAPPTFDAPPRQPTADEVLGVVGGAALTPEQQLARNLQLPLTQPVHLPPGTPGPRRILQQLHDAQSWQELEAALYQYSPQQQQAPAAARPATGQAAESPQQQQQQQQQAGVLPPAAKQRRKQPVRTLSVPINVGSSSAASQPLEPQPQPQPPAAAQRAQQLRLPDQQQQQQVLNALHISEAFQRLAVLLPHRPQALAAQDRARVTALLAHLCALAARLCESCDMDARGCAQLALNLSKLGQRDSQLIAALQDAVLGQVGAFSARQTAVLLVGLAKLDARPSRELWAALQQHILASLHLFDQQSLSCTIWAAAKFSAAGAGGATAAAPLSQPAPGDAAAAEAEEQDARRQQRAQQALVAALMRRCDPQMRQWQGRHLAQAAWGLACLGARPDAAWAECFLAAAGGQLPQMNTQDLANVVSALPQLGIAPPQPWVDAWAATATKKLHGAQPLAVFSLLLGLARLRQAQRRAAAKAARRHAKQQQQQQQQQARGEGGVSGRSSSSSWCPVSSLAELRLLRAAVLWLSKHPGALQQRQLSCVIAALSELLPRLVKRAAEQAATGGSAAAEQAAAVVSDADGPPASGAHASHESEARLDAEQQQQQQQKWAEAERHLLEHLLQLLPQWEGSVPGLVAAAGRPRQRRLVTLAWTRLAALCGYVPQQQPDGAGGSR